MLVRSFEKPDSQAVLALSDRLTEGMAGWIDTETASSTVRGWVSGSIAQHHASDRQVYVAEDAGEVIGFVTVSEQTHFSGLPVAYVGELVVAAAAARNGVGRALMEEAEQWALHRGLQRLSLETGAGNHAGLAFYRALGYAADDIRLSRDISAPC